MGISHRTNDQANQQPGEIEAESCLGEDQEDVVACEGFVQAWPLTAEAFTQVLVWLCRFCGLHVPAKDSQVGEVFVM